MSWRARETLVNAECMFPFGDVLMMQSFHGGAAVEILLYGQLGAVYPTKSTHFALGDRETKYLVFYCFLFKFRTH